MAFHGLQAGAGRSIQPLAVHAQHADAVLIQQVPQGRAIGWKFIARMQHQRRAGGQARCQPIPGHGVGAGVEEDLVLAPQVHVQHQFLQVLDKRATGTVHQQFAGAAIDDGAGEIQRMVEGQGFEFDVGRFERRNEIFEIAGWAHDDDSSRRQARGQGQVFRRGEDQRRLHRLHCRQRVVLRQVRRAGKPGRADGSRGQHRHQRVGNIRQQCGDTVAGYYTGSAHGRGEHRDAALQLAVADVFVLVRRAVAADGDPVIVEAQQILREIQADAGKPSRERHAVVVHQYRHAFAAAADANEVP